jgi:tetratricopeptide (TPR) repeat protein
MVRPERLKQILSSLRTAIGDSSGSAEGNTIPASIESALAELLLEIESAEVGDNFTRHAGLVLKTFEEIGLPNAQPDSTGQILQGIGRTYERLGDTANAYDAYSRALEFATQANDVSLAAGCRRRMGRIMTNTADFDTAERHLTASRLEYEKLNDKLGKAQVICDIGSLYFQRGEIDRAESAYLEALTVAEESGSKRTIINLHNNLGILSNVRGVTDKAIEQYEQSRKLAEELGDDTLLAQVRHNLGMAYADKREWAAANEHYEQTLEIARQKGLGPLVAITYLNKAQLYVELSDLTQAAESCGKALCVFRQSGDKLGEAEAYRILGDVFARRGNEVTAMRMLDFSLEITMRANSPLEIGESHRAKGAVAERLGRKDEAIESYKQALTYFERCSAERDCEDMRRRLEQMTHA